MTTLDDSYFNILNTICVTCKHYQGGGECDAFPEGIPQEIISGAHVHTTPFPGDNGIMFEAED